MCEFDNLGGIIVAVCYNNLWKLLIDKNMNKTKLKEAAGISFNVIARMGKNETISFESIEKICSALNCNIGDIISIAQETKEEVKAKTFTTIELFAGAGGLALGIEKAGFDTIGLIEFDKAASDTLKCNRPEWRVINDDIANISCLDLEEYFRIEKGKLDLLSGGAPCQSFSYAGKRLGLEDARGTLFYHYAKFLKQLQPKMFLFENVKGLLTHDRGRTYKTITDIFENTGYTIQKRVLNAWDYGVAQKRERLITIGIRNDLTDKIHFDFPAPHKYKPVLRDILLDCPKSEGTPYSEYKRKIFELVPPGGYWRNIPEDIAKDRLYRLNEKVNAYYLKGNERFVGTIQEVLVDGESKNGEGMMCGYTKNLKLCHFKSDDKSLVGKLVNVKITEAKSWFVIGELCE